MNLSSYYAGVTKYIFPLQSLPHYELIRSCGAPAKKITTDLLPLWQSKQFFLGGHQLHQVILVVCVYV